MSPSGSTRRRPLSGTVTGSAARWRAAIRQSVEFSRHSRLRSYLEHGSQKPDNGRLYDPCCGSSGMFVQGEEFIREHGGGGSATSRSLALKVTPGSITFQK